MNLFTGNLHVMLFVGMIADVRVCVEVCYGAGIYCHCLIRIRMSDAI